MESRLDSVLVYAASASAATVGARRGHLTGARPLPLDAPEISVVVPVYDEVESVQQLYRSTVAALSRFGRPWEIVVVDDGSTDGTYEAFAELAATDPRLRLIRFGRNFGQTAAMAAGIDHARGTVIVPMDGDLQNDPEDIPVLVAKLDEGYDVVSGWRERRQDRALTRKLPSRAANWLIGRVTGVPLHDYGCTLKAYRAEIIKQTRLYGEMHRFVPALAHIMGARIAEVPVRHHARQFGRSKYGIGRTFNVMLDLLTLKFLSAYGTKPIRVFGGAGLFLCLGGIAAGAYTLYEKWFDGIYVHRNPVILLAVFLFLLGFSFILLGLIAELIIRTYHESQEKPIYWIRESRNLDSDAPLSRQS